MVYTRDEIERRVTEIVAQALDSDPAKVHRHSSLIDDLGAESIDFLDIRYRLETAFQIKISEDDLWRGFVVGEHRDLLSENGVTEEGLKRLQSEMPDFRWERFPEGVRRRDLPRLITVRTIIEYLVSLLGTE